MPEENVMQNFEKLESKLLALKDLEAEHYALHAHKVSELLADLVATLRTAIPLEGKRKVGGEDHDPDLERFVEHLNPFL